MRKSMNQKGLTIIEMVVGMVIAVAFVGLMVQSYIVTMKINQTGTQRVEQLEEGQLVLEQISRDLHSAVPTVDSTGNFRFQLGSPDTTSHESFYLDFVRVNSSTDSTASPLQEISYIVGTSDRILRGEGVSQDKILHPIKTDKKPSIKKETKAKAGLPQTFTSPAGRPLGVGLSNTTYTLNLTCLEQSSTGDHWISTWVNRNTLPPFVKVELKLRNKLNPNNQIELSRIVQVGGL